MKIDVIIPVYRPEKAFFSNLKKILMQKLSPNRIIILLTVDEEYCREYFEADLSENGIFDHKISIREIEKENFSHGGTRQLGSELSDADYILFMTQDAEPCDRLLIGRLLKCFTEKTAVAFARQLPNRNAALIERFSRLFNYPSESYVKTKKDLESGSVRSIFCSDVCAMYKKDVFVSLGGFDTDVNFNEDELFAFKALSADYSVSYCAEARVYHSHNLTLRQQFERNIQIAVSQKAHPEVFESLSSGGEGIRYVRKGLRYVVCKGTFFDAAYFIIYCGVRYIGFLIGKHVAVEDSDE